jgi:hypothetical protein
MQLELLFPREDIVFILCIDPGDVFDRYLISFRAPPAYLLPWLPPDSYYGVGYYQLSCY